MRGEAERGELSSVTACGWSLSVSCRAACAPEKSCAFKSSNMHLISFALSRSY